MNKSLSQQLETAARRQRQAQIKEQSAKTSKAKWDARIIKLRGKLANKFDEETRKYQRLAAQAEELGLIGQTAETSKLTPKGKRIFHCTNVKEAIMEVLGGTWVQMENIRNALTAEGFTYAQQTINIQTSPKQWDVSDTFEDKNGQLWVMQRRMCKEDTRKNEYRRVRA